MAGVATVGVGLAADWVMAKVAAKSEGTVASCGVDNPPSYRDSSRCNALRWSTGSHPVGRGRCSRNSRRKHLGFHRPILVSSAVETVVAETAVAVRVGDWVAVGLPVAAAALAAT